MSYYGFTDTGNIRPDNEDSFVIKKIDKNFIAGVVADGMGGHKGGKEASSFACEELIKEIEENSKAFCKYTQKQKENFLKNAIIKVNKSLYKKSQEDAELSGMGTTVVVCVILNKKYYIANVGDSRLYIIDNTLNQITKDHSFVTELVDLGVITKEQAQNHPNKNVITRAVGTEASVEPDIYTGVLKTDNIILICTDGLTNMVDDETIFNTVKSGTDITSTANKLISLAKQNGGTDNITAVLIKASNGGDNTL